MFVHGAVLNFWTWVQIPPSPPILNISSLSLIFMDKKKTNPNIFLGISCVILSLISITLGILLVLNLKEFEKLSDEVKDLQKTSDVIEVVNEKEEVTKVEECSLEFLADYVEGGVLDISLVLPEGSEDKGHIYAKAFYREKEGDFKECVYDFYDHVVGKHEKIDINEYTFGNIIYVGQVGKGNIVYMYDNAIYMQNLFNDNIPEILAESDEIAKGTLLVKNEAYLHIDGPYMIYPYIYFRTDLTYGCTDGEEEYCASMDLAYEELEKKNLLGLWEYDLEKREMKNISSR